MSHEYDIPADDLARLADGLDIKSEESRNTFYNAMNWAVFKYAITKDMPLDIGKVITKTKILKERAQELIESLDETFDKFDKALSEFDELSENPTVKRKVITLRRNQRSAEEVQSCREIVKADAELWRDVACGVYGELYDEYYDPKTGKRTIKKNIGEPAFNWLLDDLINAYAAGGGSPRLSNPTPKTDPLNEANIDGNVTREYSGPMFRFIESCFDLIGVEKKNNPAMGSAIRKAINRWKKKNPKPTE